MKRNQKNLENKLNRKKMKRSDLITVKEFNSREDLLKFLNELDKKYNLNQIIINKLLKL